MADGNIKRLLLLDDDEDFRKLMLVHLGKLLEGVEVEEYDPSDRGLPDQDFNWSRYDVLLLDYNLNLPGATGLDLLQANRKNMQFPATIMLTGAGNEEVAVRALKAGVYDYLRKEKLGKARLRNSILEAYEEHRKERDRQNELTSHSHAFNKALFYQELEKHLAESDEKNRTFLLISLDNHQDIEERAGLIMRDNIIRHFAKASFHVFRAGNCHPSITRFSDVSAALLIDDPVTRSNLEYNLKGLCDYLTKHKYKYQDQEYPFTVSIGAVRLHEHSGKAEEVIRDARGACRRAEEQKGNSYVIYTDEQVMPASEARGSAVEPAQEKPKKPVTKEKPAPAEKPSAATASPPPPKAAPGRKQAPAAAAKPKPAPAAATEPAAETASEQSGKALMIKKAFEENRVIQTFQPAITLFSSEEENTATSEIYYVSPKLIDTDGSSLEAQEILDNTDTPAFQQLIDRWMLREAIGRVVNSEQGRFLFLLRLSRASLADPGLFNWLRKLLAAFESRRPGESIALEIPVNDYIALQKPAGALISYLGKSHGFKFVLVGVDREHDISDITANTPFNMIRLDQAIIKELQSRPASGGAGETALNALKSKGLSIIADGIEDADALTTAISSGADYAMGVFVGEPVEQLDNQANIESFEIV
jgi:EAL domain-containing protein (putative c-di-GMP-specific phosphodiesterase class I)/FixJ family two-component response regulator